MADSARMNSSWSSYFVLGALQDFAVFLCGTWAELDQPYSGDLLGVCRFGLALVLSRRVSRSLGEFCSGFSGLILRGNLCKL